MRLKLVFFLPASPSAQSPTAKHQRTQHQLVKHKGLLGPSPQSQQTWCHQRVSFLHLSYSVTSLFFR